MKIGGERAYRLARRGVDVEMPLRRSPVHALDVIAYSGDATRSRAARAARQLGHLRARRSRRRSAATARRCAGRRSGRSTSTRREPVDAARAPAGRRRRSRGCRTDALDARARIAVRAACSRWRRSVNVARTPSELERAPRAVAIGTFDGVHLGHRAVIARGGRRGAPADGRHVRPAPADGRSATRSSCSRRSSGGSSCSPSCGVEDDARRRVHARDSPRLRRRRSRATYLVAIGAEVVVAGDGLPLRARAARATSTLLRSLGLDARAVPLVEGISSTRIRQLAHAGEVDAAARLLGRPLEVDGHRRRRRPARRDARLPDREPARRPDAARARRSASTRARSATGGRRSRSASTRTTAAPSGGSRRTCSTGRATCTATGSSSSSGGACATSGRSRARQALVGQIARDVEETRARDAAGLIAQVTAACGVLLPHGHATTSSTSTASAASSAGRPTSSPPTAAP